MSPTASALASAWTSPWEGSLSTLEASARIVSALFLFAFGACVGSFLNVVVYRLPAGLSVVTPPSRCPSCGGRLSWRENLPVLGWLLLRGRCRHCRTKISIQYPLIEFLVGALFAGVYLVLYASPSGSWLREIGGPWWPGQGFANSWPTYIALVFLFAGLIGMTLIDARTFTIPIEITRTCAALGLAAAVVQPLLPILPKAAGSWPVPLVGWAATGVGIGGFLGVLATWGLLASGRLGYSFADWSEHVKDGDAISSYPFARREMGKEMFAVAPILLGATLGWILSLATSRGEAPPLWLASVGSSCLGFVVGGGILWAVRILFTALLGREALGIGDVHLLAAVGSVLGWRDPIWIFALSPIFALSWVAVGLVVGRILRRRWLEVPLGPHLAAATALVYFGRPGIAWLLEHGLAWDRELVARVLGAA